MSQKFTDQNDLCDCISYTWLDIYHLRLSSYIQKIRFHNGRKNLWRYVRSWTTNQLASEFHYETQHTTNQNETNVKCFVVFSNIHYRKWFSTGKNLSSEYTQINAFTIIARCRNKAIFSDHQGFKWEVKFIANNIRYRVGRAYLLYSRHVSKTIFFFKITSLRAWEQTKYWRTNS